MEGVTITKISQTKKGRIALFGEQGFLFSLDEETYARRPVREGEVLSPAELNGLHKGSETVKAREKAFDYLGMRAYGSMELYRKLLEKFDEHSAAAAVAKMNDLGLLNDEAFARAKANALKQRGKSRREIEWQLSQKGLERSTVSLVLEELFAEDDESETVLAQMQKQYRTKLMQGKTQNVFAALARKGFSSRAVRDAYRLWCEQNDTRPEEDI